MLYEKYRPSTLNEILGQEQIVQAVRLMIEKDKQGIQPFPHTAFVGTPGTGKTTMAHAIANELNLPLTEVNASDERRLADVREKIKPMSKYLTRQIIYLGEADNIDGDAQQALRRIIETTPKATFIMSLNREWKIIDPIKSRFVWFRFKPLDSMLIGKRLIEICQREGILIEEKDKEPLMSLVKESRGDMRRALGTLESSITPDKRLSAFAIEGFKRQNFAGRALQLAVTGSFELARKAVEDAYIQANLDPSYIIEDLYYAIDTLTEATPEVKIRLYSKLGEIEGRLKTGSNPLIQISSLMAYAWLYPHLPTECPAKRD
jgi:replication factor C small subunit